MNLSKQQTTNPLAALKAAYHQGTALGLGTIFGGFFDHTLWLVTAILSVTFLLVRSTYYGENDKDEV